MMAFDVRGGIKDITAHLTSLQRRHVPFATALALTRTAKFIEIKEREEVRRVFDRPTRFTQNAFFVRPATKSRLWAEVKVKDESLKAVPPIKWLAPQIFGGRRTAKRFEDLLRKRGLLPPGMFVVPATGARLDAYGNVSRGQLQQILAQLQAARDPLQRETKRSRKQRTRGRYLVAYPGQKRTAHLKPGIYERNDFAFGSAVRPVFIYVRAPRYRKRLRFYEIADGVGRARFPIEFALAMRHALRTAR